MKQEPSSQRRIVHTGPGMAIGAALGLLGGLMLLDNAVAGLLVGVVLGFLIGAVYQMQAGREI